MILNYLEGQLQKESKIIGDLGLPYGLTPMSMIKNNRDSSKRPSRNQMYKDFNTVSET